MNGDFNRVECLVLFQKFIVGIVSSTAGEKSKGRIRKQVTRFFWLEVIHHVKLYCIVLTKSLFVTAQVDIILKNSKPLTLHALYCHYLSLAARIPVSRKFADRVL